MPLRALFVFVLVAIALFGSACAVSDSSTTPSTNEPVGSTERRVSG